MNHQRFTLFFYFISSCDIQRVVVLLLGRISHLFPPSLLNINHLPKDLILRLQNLLLLRLRRRFDDAPGRRHL